MTVLLLCGAGAGLVALSHEHGLRPRLGAASPSPAAAGRADDIDAATQLSPSTSPPATRRPAAAPNMCRANTAAQRVIVSIRQQHAWMCAGSRQVYTTPATTGASAVGNGT